MSSTVPDLSVVLHHPRPSSLASQRLTALGSFEMNRPSVWKRVALIGFLLFVLWVGFRLRLSGVEETVIHSERYSGKYKYRPAASPVITTHMPDGKLKVSAKWGRI